MALPTLRTLSRLASTFRADLNAFFGGEIQAWSTAVTAMGAALTSFVSGTAFSLEYTLADETADADPGAGLVRLDNFAVQTSATVLRIDLTDAASNDRTARLATWAASTSAVKGQLRIVDLDDTENWLEAEITAMASPAGYRNFTLANVTGSAAAPFADGANLVLKFTRTGDKGDTGAAGATPLTYTARNSGTNAQLSAANFASGTRIALHWTGATAFTQTIIAAATVGAGNWLPFKNDASVTITIDPASSENITGNGATATTLKILPGESGILSCDGSAFYVTGLAPKGSWIELSRVVASGASSINHANVFTSDFDEYIIQNETLIPGTDNTAIWGRTSTDGGATYDSGASNYLLTGGSTDTKIILTGGGVGNDTGESSSQTIRVIKPSSAAYCFVTWHGYRVGNTGQLNVDSGAAARAAAADVDSFQTLPATGTISGTSVVYGIKK